MTFGVRLGRQKRVYQADDCSEAEQPVADSAVVPGAVSGNAGRWARVSRLPWLARRQVQSIQTIAAAGGGATVQNTGNMEEKQTATCKSSRNACSSRLRLRIRSWLFSSDKLSISGEGLVDESSEPPSPVAKDAAPSGDVAPLGTRNRVVFDAEGRLRPSTEKDVCLWRLVSLMYEQNLNDDELASLLETCPEVRWIAQCASRTPLPPGWRKDHALRIFVCEATGTVSATPPNIAHFVQLARLAVRARQVPQEALMARKWIESMMQEAIRESARIAEAWSGPHVDAVSGTEYYHCAATGTSTWENPSAGNAFLACVAHRLLQSEAFPDADAQRSLMPVAQTQPNAETLFLAGLAAQLLHLDPGLTGQLSNVQHQGTATRPHPLVAASERAAKRLGNSTEPAADDTTALALIQAEGLEPEEQTTTETAIVVAAPQHTEAASAETAQEQCAMKKVDVPSQQAEAAPVEAAQEQSATEEDIGSPRWLSKKEVMKELGLDEEQGPRYAEQQMPDESDEANQTALAEEDRFSCWSFGDKADTPRLVFEEHEEAAEPLPFSGDLAEEELTHLKSLLAPPVTANGDTIQEILAELADDASVVEEAQHSVSIIPVIIEEPEDEEPSSTSEEPAERPQAQESPPAGRAPIALAALPSPSTAGAKSYVLDLDVGTSASDSAAVRTSTSSLASLPTMSQLAPAPDRDTSASGSAAAGTSALSSLASLPKMSQLAPVPLTPAPDRDSSASGSAAVGTSTLSSLASLPTMSPLAPVPLTPASAEVMEYVPEPRKLPSKEDAQQGMIGSSVVEALAKPATVKVERWPCSTPLPPKRKSAPTKLATPPLTSSTATQGADGSNAAKPRAGPAGPGWQPPPRSPREANVATGGKANAIKRALKNGGSPAALAPLPGFECKT